MATVSEEFAASYDPFVSLDGKVILVDMDNTLVDWDSQFYSMMSRLHPHVPLTTRETRINWSIERNYPSQYERAILGLTNEPEFWRTMPPMSGGIEAMKAMVTGGLNVFIVSTPDPQHTARCAKEKFDWVEHYLGQSWKNKVILTADKTLIRGDVLIDDKPNVCQGLHDPSWIHVLYHHAYNSMYTKTPRLERWNDWKQVLLDVIRNKQSLYGLQTDYLRETTMINSPGQHQDDIVCEVAHR